MRKFTMDTRLSFPPPHHRAIIREPGYEVSNDCAIAIKITFCCVRNYDDLVVKVWVQSNIVLLILNHLDGGMFQETAGGC